MNLDRELEASLGRAMAPTPDADDAAAQRMIARLDASPLPPQKRGLLAAWWPAALMDIDFAPAWPRVAALACAAALGVSIGLSGVGTRIASDLDLVRMASADEAGVNIFDSESIAGLRP
jgi:hypothetical protein